MTTEKRDVRDFQIVSENKSVTMIEYRGFTYNVCSKCGHVQREDDTFCQWCCFNFACRTKECKGCDTKLHTGRGAFTRDSRLVLVKCNDGSYKLIFDEDLKWYIEALEHYETLLRNMENDGKWADNMSRDDVRNEINHLGNSFDKKLSEITWGMQRIREYMKKWQAEQDTLSKPSCSSKDD